MNRLHAFMTALTSLLLILSCSNEQIQSTEPTDGISLKMAAQKAITVPFKATFYTLRDYSFTPDCSAYASDVPEEDFGSAGNYQVGEGEGTHLGKFTTIISFCGGPNFQYKAGEGVFVAANGDALYYNIPPPGVIGQIYQIFDDPYYELWFGDAFEFTGGTGRFEGATGGGYTDSWVNLIEGGWANFPDGFIPEHQTDHVFTGTLTFYPGSASK
ncbi:hypothetical protein [Gaetbulibacter aestuarii]|uniref:Uncharacterized protein n=1 Tax=Gaetbulibacter aestuarii TaxID=1502358 RepID=A0ABW7MZB5_9FLAO